MEQLKACIEREGLPEDELAEIRDAIHQRAFSTVNADWLPNQYAPELAKVKFDGKVSAKETKQSTPQQESLFPAHQAIQEQKIENSPPFTKEDLEHFQTRKKMLEALNKQ